MDKKKNLLVFIDWYVPGFKAGGPIKSVYNISSKLSDQFNVFIVTSDRDLGDLEAYPSVETDKWLTLESSEVMYLSKKYQTIGFYKKVLKERNYEAIYINGIFSLSFSIYPLIASKLIGYSSNVVISPRGMLGKGALKIKSLKKSIFISAMKNLGFYNSVKWHATSQGEAKEIRKEIYEKAHVEIVPNFPSVNQGLSKDNKVNDESIRLVFFSRISEKKNLMFALKVLQSLESTTKVIYDIYGPMDDSEYWKKCERLIEKSPSNVKISYKGTLHPSEIPTTVSHYDALFFPSSHENFGHTIIEALQSGLFVIISDQTPWSDVAEYNVGEAIPLNQHQKFIKSISSFSRKEDSIQFELNRKYLEAKLNPLEIKSAYQSLFSNH